MGFKFLFLAHLLSEEIQTIAFVAFPLQTEQLGLCTHLLATPPLHPTFSLDATSLSLSSEHFPAFLGDFFFGF